MKLIRLTNSNKVAMIDDEDYHLIHGLNWQLVTKKRVDYAFSAFKSGENRDRIPLHRLVMQAKKTDPEVDHRNHNGLDCRKENLRFATDSQNAINQRVRLGRKYKGVYFEVERLSWRVRLTFKGKTFTVGRFATEEEAARAYDSRAKELFGEFACLNFQ